MSVHLTQTIKKYWADSLKIKEALGIPADEQLSEITSDKKGDWYVMTIK